MNNRKSRPGGNRTASGISENIGSSRNSPVGADPQARRQEVIARIVSEASAALSGVPPLVMIERVTISGRRYRCDAYGRVTSWSDILVSPPGEGWEPEPGSSGTWIRTLHPFGKPWGAL